MRRFRWSLRWQVLVVGESNEIWWCVVDRRNLRIVNRGLTKRI